MALSLCRRRLQANAGVYRAVLVEGIAAAGDVIELID